jgi:hypothetical protein
LRNERGILAVSFIGAQQVLRFGSCPGPIEGQSSYISKLFMGRGIFDGRKKKQNDFC